MGSVLAVRFSQHSDVTLYVNFSHPGVEYHKDMTVYSDNGVVITGKIAKITFDLSEAIAKAEWIFVTYPAFMFEEMAFRMMPLLSKEQHLIFVPGSGGAEFFFKGALTKGCTITGLQRVHAVARIIERGISVHEAGIRPRLKVASIPQSFNPTACNILADLYQMPVEGLGTYLNLTLINSNSLLHTSRLYRLFSNYQPGITEYERIPLFYEEWDDVTSKLLIDMDRELFEVIDALNRHGCDIHSITPILEHYESHDAESLTRKIRSIESLKGLPTPLIQTENGRFIPDLGSRYFIADFPFGLGFLITIADSFQMRCPVLDLVFDWYCCIVGNKHKCVSCFSGIQEIHSLARYYR